MFNSRKLLQLAALTLISILLFSLPLLAVADIAKSDENLVIKSGVKESGPRFFSGRSVKIDGDIDGTAFAAGQEITVNGTINGDLFTAGQEVTINGKILGNLYSAGQDVNIYGNVSGDTFAAGQRLDVAKDALLQRDAMLAGSKINLGARVQRGLWGYGENISISGLVGADTNIEAENLEIRDGAVLGGALKYCSANSASIAGNSKINGPVNWQKREPQKAPPQRDTSGDMFTGLFFGLLAALLIWFLMDLWRPSFWTKTTASIKEQPLKTLGVGALVLILTPIVTIIMLITIIGIPLGLILGLVYAICIYLAKIIVGVFIGSLLAQRFQWPLLHRGVWVVLLGLAILALLTKIPVIGFLVTILVIFAGLGAIVLAFSKPEGKEETHLTPSPVE